MRFTVAAALALVFNAAPAYARQSDPEIPAATVAVADDAGVDPVDLAGAVNAMQDAGVDVSPREYLYAVGELQRPYSPPPRYAGPPVGGGPFGLSPYLTRVASCETGGFRSDVIYGPTRGRLGEIGLAQLAPFGLLPTFYRVGFTNPWNPWQAAAFMIWAFAHGLGNRWACA